MKLKLFQIDAFTDKIFSGNPACVVPMKSWPPDEVLLNIAKENAVAETAFFIDNGDSVHLRWFTPEIEMDLCGHATLATAHCLHTILNYPKNQIVFSSRSGELKVRIEDDWYHMDFPSRKPQPAQLPEIVSQSLNIQPNEVFKSRDYVLVYEHEKEIANIKVDQQILDQINLDPGGVIVTAKGTDCDFVSRYFTAQSSILEDPVTGSAHCSLTPFWSERLGKTTMNAKQLSERSGYIKCEDQGKRVIISGKAKTYSSGYIWLD